MAVTETQVAALELEKVLTRIQTAFDSDDKFYANIQKRNVEKISNRLMRIPIEIRPGGDFGYFNPDGGDLGRGGGQTWDKATTNCVFMKEAIEYTKLTEWSTDSDRKAIAQAVRKLTTRATLELRRQIDSQMMQDGTGSLGVVTSDTPAGGSNVILMDQSFGARLVRYGQTVQVFNAALNTNRGTATVTGWDVATRTVTLTPQIAGVVATDILVAQGIATPTSFPGLLGVPYHHNASSTGTWLGFPRASFPEIRSNRVNAGGSALTLPLPRLAVNAIGNRVGIDNGIKLQAWMHPAQQQAYEEIGQLVSVINKIDKSEGLNMYFGGAMQMAGAQVKTSFNWNTSRIDFVNNEVWGRAEVLPVGFYKTDGRSIYETRGASGGVAASDIFYMVCGMQTFVDNPAATSFIDVLAVPAGY
jgi:hypothetical protein